MERFESKLVRTAEVTLPCHLGLHMRLATGFIHLARKFRSEIRIHKGKAVGDGKSVFGLLLLGAAWNSRLLLEAKGEDAANAIREIEKYFTDKTNCLDEVR